MLSVRGDGNSLSAVAYRLISPRTLLFVFIFFCLLLVAGAFVNLIAGVLSNPTVPLGIIALAATGLLMGQMLYRWKMDLIVVTAITLTIDLVAMGVGPLGLQQVTQGDQFKTIQGPVGQIFLSLNQAIGTQPVCQYFDPTARQFKGSVASITPAYILWMWSSLLPWSSWSSG
ncbi:MAG: hypothetical protein J7452_00555 [Thermoflexus sp.]|nr:hypothetical protein [Thermoflexus sp.]